MVTTGLAAAAALRPAGALRRLLDTCPDDAPGQRAWRWQVRRLLAPLRDTVVGADQGSAAGLAARRGGCLRGEEALVRRVTAMGPRVLGDTDLPLLRRELHLLLDDLRRHRQRCHDLAYDEVELELGGSE